jgi:hypothetical protein
MPSTRGLAGPGRGRGVCDLVVAARLQLAARGPAPGHKSAGANEAAVARARMRAGAATRRYARSIHTQRGRLVIWPSFQPSAEFWTIQSWQPGGSGRRRAQARCVSAKRIKTDGMHARGIRTQRMVCTRARGTRPCGARDRTLGLQNLNKGSRTRGCAAKSWQLRPRAFRAGSNDRAAACVATSGGGSLLGSQPFSSRRPRPSAATLAVSNRAVAMRATVASFVTDVASHLLPRPTRFPR